MSKPSAIVNGIAAAAASGSSQRLRLNPNKDHKPENYEDLNDQLEFSPSVFSSLERYLPPNVLNLSRDEKVTFMRDILNKYLPQSDLTRVHQILVGDVRRWIRVWVCCQSCMMDGVCCEFIMCSLQLLWALLTVVIVIRQIFWVLLILAQKHKNYRQKILAHFQPFYREIYVLQPETFFVPSFLKAIADNTEESFRSIMTEPTPGLFIFEMFQPHFCNMMVSEVYNIANWVNETKFIIMRPNTMNKHGAVLDDFGLDSMLDKLMEGFVRPISKVFFPEVGGTTLDSHHGFVVEYGDQRDVDLGFHVDDSEVTLNVCLGTQFSGGELFFRGIRCEKHVNSDTKPEEIFDYSHVPGQAVLHRGRHRHGARATTSGDRINMLLWCRSSVFREMRKYQTDFSSWCGECMREKKERQCLSIAAMKRELLKVEGEGTT